MDELLVYAAIALFSGFVAFRARRTYLRHKVTPLHRAAQAGDISTIHQLVGQGADINAVAGSSGTPLMQAAYKKQHEAVRQLLSLGAKVDVVDRINQTALHYAAAAGDMLSARYLIEAGAPLDITSRLFNKTPQQMAEILGHQAVAELIRSHAQRH